MGDAAPPAPGTLQKSYFDVLGICCPSEVPLVEKLLRPLPGVSTVTVIVPSRTVIVLHDAAATSPAQIGMRALPFYFPTIVRPARDGRPFRVATRRRRDQTGPRPDVVYYYLLVPVPDRSPPPPTRLNCTYDDIKYGRHRQSQHAMFDVTVAAMITCVLFVLFVFFR